MLDEFRRLSHFAFIFGADESHDFVAMHTLLHIRRRNKVAGFAIDFEEAKTFVTGFDGAFFFRQGFLDFLLKLREARIVLEHLFYLTV
ncbi:Uncharacterised protein [Vibrio cholerae]|nr:Uncharacterised protein [Vibrio cholerae]